MTESAASGDTSRDVLIGRILSDVEQRRTQGETVNEAEILGPHEGTDRLTDSAPNKSASSTHGDA